MKRHYFCASVIGFCICVTANNCYPCEDGPKAVISGHTDPRFVHRNHQMSYFGDESEGSIEMCHWSWTGAVDEDSVSYGTFTHPNDIFRCKFTELTECDTCFSVTLKVEDSHEPPRTDSTNCYVKVVEVGISADSSYVPVNDDDDDFRSFLVSISPHADLVEQFPNSKMRITFGSSVKIWETKTKKTVLDESSELSSGHEYVIENLPKQLYLEGVSGSSTLKDVELKATWVPQSFSDSVNVTVFEVELEGFFGFDDQHNAQENDRRLHDFDASSDKVGLISWDDANADGTKGDTDPNCLYFHNCMECRGTVKPSGVTDEVTFDFTRKMWSKAWRKLDAGSWSVWDDCTGYWHNDEVDYDEDVTVSATDHIYEIDGPGLRMKDQGEFYDHLASVGDFYEWVEVVIDGSSYQCSDYYKWHSQWYLKPKNATELTRDSSTLQKLGSGWITVPDTP